MQYYLSLCCIIKNERNLEEFILYYIILGVEHFYIYDNNSDFPIKDRLNSFFYKKYCTIIDYPGKYKQMPAYNDCINRTKDISEWLIICDGDEYIVPKQTFSLRDFLHDYEDCQALGINWVFFGSSFYDNKQDGFLIDKYKYSSASQNDHIKTVCKPKYSIKMLSPHMIEVQDMTKYVDARRNNIYSSFNCNYTIDLININHYHTKSKEDLDEKYNRGNADSECRVHVPDDIHNSDNELYNDYTCNKYLPHIQKIHRLTGVNWAIYKELNNDLKDKLLTEDDYYDHIINNSIKEERYLHVKDKYFLYCFVA
jgi:hypothetical protein